tara:strand:+ start:2527 stop:3513 length:987 start_codon:yes stop_codon:yes gene_type:complete
MKALILAAGKGTRLYPATQSTPKPLMPLAGKETLCFIIEEIIENGIREIGLVVSEENHKEIKNFISLRKYKNISMIVQKDQLGVAHAVKISKNFILEDDFILYLGDNLFENGIKNLIDEFKDNDSSVLCVKSVNDPRKFGVAVVKNNGNLKEIVEKPKIPPSKLAVTGIYGFKNKILEYIDKIKMSERGEFEITDAIKLSIERNDIVKTLVVDGWWIDTGNIHDFLEANKNKTIEFVNSKKNLESLNEETHIEGFCIIKDEKGIKNSIIKNFSFIEENVNINNSKIENCVVLKNSDIKNYILKNCIISKGTKLINNTSNMKIVENKII